MKVLEICKLRKEKFILMTLDSHTNILTMLVAMLCMTIMMIMFDEDDDDECLIKIIIIRLLRIVFLDTACRWLSWLSIELSCGRS